MKLIRLSIWFAHLLGRIGSWFTLKSLAIGSKAAGKAIDRYGLDMAHLMLTGRRLPRERVTVVKGDGTVN